MKKPLLITSAYPSTEDGERILKSVLAQLQDDFDILLATHCPVSKEIQGMVKYFVYDHRNEMINQDPQMHFWADYPSFYFKIHKEEGTKHHSYAVFRSIMNAVYLMEDYYDDFIYLEGDCLMSKEDILKLKEFRQICIREDKDAIFFKFYEFISSLVFYSKMKFFREVYAFPRTAEEYEQHSKNIGSYGTLENFLYKSVDTKNAFDRVYQLENKNMAEYFSTSKLGINTFLDGKVIYEQAYFSDVARLENSREMAFVYISNSASTFEKEMDVFVDDEKICTLPTGPHATVIRINPKNEEFLVRFGQSRVRKYRKSWIFNDKNPSFARFK